MSRVSKLTRLWWSIGAWLAVWKRLSVLSRWSYRRTIRPLCIVGLLRWCGVRLLWRLLGKLRWRGLWRGSIHGRRRAGYRFHNRRRILLLLGSVNHGSDASEVTPTENVSSETYIEVVVVALSASKMLTGGVVVEVKSKRRIRRGICHPKYLDMSHVGFCRQAITCCGEYVLVAALISLIKLDDISNDRVPFSWL